MIQKGPCNRRKGLINLANCFAYIILTEMKAEDLITLLCSTTEKGNRLHRRETSIAGRAAAPFAFKRGFPPERVDFFFPPLDTGNIFVRLLLL